MQQCLAILLYHEFSDLLELYEEARWGDYTGSYVVHLHGGRGGECVCTRKDAEKWAEKGWFSDTS